MSNAAEEALRGLGHERPPAIATAQPLDERTRAAFRATARALEVDALALHETGVMLRLLKEALRPLDARDAEGDPATDLVERTGDGADYAALHMRRLAAGLRALAEVEA